jgi:hypothetical protein
MWRGSTKFIGRLLFIMFFSFHTLSPATPAIGDDVWSRVSTNGERPGFGFVGYSFDMLSIFYRQFFPNNFGIAAGMGGWYSTSSGGKLGIFAAPSYTLKHMAFAGKRLPELSLRLYVLGQLGFNFQRQRESEFVKKTDTYVSSFNTYYTPSIAPGLGVELYFNRYVGIFLEIPWVTSLQIGGPEVLIDSRPKGNFGVSFYL